MAARLLRSWVTIPPGAWIFVCCECYVLSGRGLCDELITRPEESYRLWCVVIYDQETSRMRRPWPAEGHRATENKTKLTHTLKIMCMTTNEQVFYPPCSTSSEFRRNASSISVLCSYGAYLFYGRTDRRTDCSFPEMVQWNFTIYTSFHSCYPQLRWTVLNSTFCYSEWQESVGLQAQFVVRKLLLRLKTLKPISIYQYFIRCKC